LKITDIKTYIVGNPWKNWIQQADREIVFSLSQPLCFLHHVPLAVLAGSS
jgi:hypothetical protein